MIDYGALLALLSLTVLTFLFLDTFLDDLGLVAVMLKETFKNKNVSLFRRIASKNTILAGVFIFVSSIAFLLFLYLIECVAAGGQP